MTEVTIHDFDKICRFCLKKCNTPFNRDPVIPSIFFKLTNIEFEGNGVLPTQVCPDCTRQIRDINFFRSQCLEAHQELTKVLTDTKVKKEEPYDPDEPYEPYEPYEAGQPPKHEPNELDVSCESISSDESYQQDENNQPQQYEHNQHQQYEPPQMYAPYNTMQPEYQYQPQETYTPYRPQSNLQCEICLQKCHDIGALLGHLKRHKRKPNTMLYQCRLCQLHFEEEYQLYAHRSRKLCPALHTCTICHEKFLRTNELRKHRLQHFKNRNKFQCEYCYIFLKTHNKLQKHLNKVHKK